MKKELLLLAGALSLSFGAMAQVYTEPFTGTTLAANWGAPAAYTLTQNNHLIVTMNDSIGPQQPGGPVGEYQNFYYAVAPANAFSMTGGCKCITFDVNNTGNSEITLYVQAGDASQGVGGVTNHYTNTTYAIIAANYVGSVTVNFAGKFTNVTSSTVYLDSTNIKSFDFQPIGKQLGAAPWNYKFKGTFTMDNLVVCGPVTGINAAQANISSSKLYPNPVSDIANIELDLISSSDVKVTLSDLMGREVMIVANGRMSSLSQSFSVASLNRGIYTVNYFINGSAAKSQLLMVK